jgi:HD superfamily phosphodiesterase
MNIRKLKKYITDKIKNEIPENLTYHGLHHTFDVLDCCNQYIKRLGLSGRDAWLLRTAALLHDVGIMWNYFDHEREGVKFAKELLPDWGYTQKDIKTISKLIMVTRIPQQPSTLLEKIICDSDLDYLGTSSFYQIGNTLYEEFLSYGVVKNEKEWDKLQIKFLSAHKYHTKFAQKHREPVKQKYLQEIIEKWK